MTNPLGNFRFKTSAYYEMGIQYHVTDPNCVCGWARVIAPGGPGCGVRLDGTPAIGTKGTDSGFNNGVKNAVARAGGVGGIQGDQGPGGTSNGNFDDVDHGRSGGGLGNGTGGIGGGGVGEAWQEHGINAPSLCGYGGGASAVPPGAPAGSQAGTGGGEGGSGTINFEGRGPYWGTVTDTTPNPRVINDNAYRFTIGVPGVVADPGAGGYRGGIPGKGRVVVTELIFEPNPALVALLGS